MAETERFGITTDNENLIVILDNDVELSQLQVCDKLNELSNEKSRLQCRLNRRTRQRDELAEFNVELMEENKELKEQLKDCQQKKRNKI